MVATQSHLLPSASSTPEPSHGGGFEGDPDEPCVAIYPGPANSLADFRSKVDGKPELIPVSEFVSWSSTAAFPQIPSRAAFRVWRKIKQHPRFDGTDIEEAEPLSLSLSRRVRSWRFRPVQGDFNATTDRHRFINDDGVSARSQSFTPPTTGTSS